MKHKILGLLAVGLLAGPTAANATLIGDTVGCGIASVDIWVCSPLTAVVGGNQEFLLNVFINSPNDPPRSDIALGVDLGANSARISNATPFGAFALDAGEILILSDLDFSGGGTIAGITNLIVSGALFLDISDITFTGHSVQINLQGSEWGPESFVSFDFVTGTVPEPGTLALLGLGLLGFGLTRRRAT